MGFVPFGKEENSSSEQKDTTSLHFHWLSNIEEISDTPVVVIGDSFSLTGEDGFPQLVGEKLNTNVGVITRNDFSIPEQDFIGLLNNGCFNKDQIVILESVERGIVSRLNKIDFESRLTENVSPIANDSEEKTVYPFSKFVSFIRIKLHIGDKPVRRNQLSKDVFSHEKYSDVLYYYQNDLDFEKYSKEEICNAADNLKTLFKYCEKSEVNLLYLIASDKYDCYEPWIVDNHKINPTLTYFSDIPNVINSKPLLQSHVDKGVMDLFYVNDTHWSGKGASIVSEALIEYINRKDIEIWQQQ